MRQATRDAGRTIAATAILALALIGAPGSHADVVVTIDSATLNVVLAEIAQQEISVPVAEGQSLTVRVADLRITGFDPTGDELEPGLIRTAMKLEVAELGSSVPVEPGISLHVVGESGKSELEMRFAELMLRLPLMRPINVGGMLPPLRFPADNLFVLEGALKDVHLATRLKSVRIEENGIRFDFGVEVQPQR